MLLYALQGQHDRGTHVQDWYDFIRFPSQSKHDCIHWYYQSLNDCQWYLICQKSHRINCFQFECIASYVQSVCFKSPVTQTGLIDLYKFAGCGFLVIISTHWKHLLRLLPIGIEWNSSGLSGVLGEKTNFNKLAMSKQNEIPNRQSWLLWKCGDLFLSAHVYHVLGLWLLYCEVRGSTYFRWNW